MKVRNGEGTLNLRGIGRREMAARDAANEFAGELSDFLANPVGGEGARAGRVGEAGQRTTVNPRGEYDR
ncbi:MAG: hypothetical protein ACOY93_02850 [Bacillota bacterium]